MPRIKLPKKGQGLHKYGKPKLPVGSCVIVIMYPHSQTVKTQIHAAKTPAKWAAIPLAMFRALTESPLGTPPQLYPKKKISSKLSRDLMKNAMRMKEPKQIPALHNASLKCQNPLKILKPRLHADNVKPRKNHPRLQLVSLAKAYPKPASPGPGKTRATMK